MESGNSGSFQSSTGDEEFDSHGDGISALNNLAAALNNHQQQPTPPRPPPCNTVSSYMYDHRQPPQPQPPPPPQQPLENYQRSFMNSYVLDWSNINTQRSETFNNPMLASVLASSHRHGSALPSVLQPPPPPSVAENTRVSPPEPPPPKKPRKRSRASRGAATTVLTTDTTNFRAMVQEFTGIPEPPFPSHFQKSRLDIFGTVSSGITTTPPYLRRPFPQKISLPFSSSSSFLGSSSSSNTNNMNINATTNTNALNYQFTPQSSSLFNLQNQFAPSFLGMKTHQESRDFVSNDDFSDQINTSMQRPTGFLGLISSDQRTSTNNNQSAVRWGNGTGSNQEDDQNHVITSAANSNFSFSSS